MTLLVDHTSQYYRIRRPRRIPAVISMLGLAVLLMLAACSSASPTPPAAEMSAASGSCSLGLPPDTGDEAAIRAVLNAEGESVVSQDIDALMRLWAADGRVSDAKNTPDDESDDQNWDGRDAIRHRYVRTVFPGAPSTVQPSDLKIAIEGDLATVTATTHIGDEVSPAGDRWQLIRVDGCWILQSLTYNLEPKQ